MRYRRRVSAEDSMELMLDTICNVFGGIIFIAILLAILTSNRTLDVRELELEQLAALAERWERFELTTQIRQQEASIEVLRQTADLSSGDHLDQVADVLANIDQQMTEARERREDAANWLQRRARSLDTETRDLQDQLDSLQAMEISAQAEIGQLVDSQKVNLRLPYETRTERNQILLLIHNHEVFFVPIHPNRELLRGAGLGDGVRVDERMMLRIPIWVVTPRGGQGINLRAEAVRDDPLLRNLAQHLNAGRHFLDIYVSPESFESFSIFRQEITRLGYRYNVRPYDGGRNGQITFSPGGDGRVQ